ncbi:MAG: transcription termination/antitermination factor NusG [Clostridia bacterium]|nr:transcription termination/antitermination factor NusG [Clostridia bacterium]
MSEQARWYVVHTYSGYENKVKANLEKTIENNNLHHMFFDIRVPMEEVVEIKDDNQQKSSMRKLLPSYVFIRMIMTDFSWYIVRNTRGVTGFVGPGSKPVPLTDAEIERLNLEEKTFNLNYQVGDNVKITCESFEDSVGIVEEIDLEKQKVRVSVFMFGRETPVVLELNQVEPLD